MPGIICVRSMIGSGVFRESREERFSILFFRKPSPLSSLSLVILSTEKKMTCRRAERKLTVGQFKYPQLRNKENRECLTNVTHTTRGYNNTDLNRESRFVVYVPRLYSQARRQVSWVIQVSDVVSLVTRVTFVQHD